VRLFEDSFRGKLKNMIVRKKYKGIIVPAVTPLTIDYQFDEVAVELIFNRFYQHNLSPFILGTTGESASLPLEIKKKYIRAVAKNKKGGSLLYAGISSNVLTESIYLAKLCADNAVDAVVASLPSYYALTHGQMKKYFEKLADAIPLPLVIYNIPATTHMSMPLELIEELSHHGNIIATKDSERNDERLQHSLGLWKDRDDFSYFLGWAAKSAYALMGGSDGLVPSTANLFPEIYSVMLKGVEEDDETKAYEMQRWSDVSGDLYQGGRTLGESLWALKLLMKQKNLCEAVVMPPLQPQADEEAIKLIQSLEQIQMS